MMSFGTVGVASAFLVAAGIVWFVRNRFSRMKPKKNQPLLRPEWTKDTVYLVQFPPAPDVRSISPFSLKLEAWLKLNKIRYENVFSRRFGQKGQIPYVELNGEQIPDSNVVIQRLSQHFQVKCDDALTSLDKAIGHAVITMMENHTAKGNFLYRYSDCVGEMLDKYFGLTPGLRRSIFVRTFPMGIRFSMFLHGIGRHSMQEVTAFVCKDLSVISEILSDKKYLFDTPGPTSYDCALFGHLAQFVYISLNPYPAQEFIRQECPNLIAYVDRVKDELWPNWDQDLASDNEIWLQSKK